MVVPVVTPKQTRPCARQRSIERTRPGQSSFHQPECIDHEMPQRKGKHQFRGCPLAEIPLARFAAYMASLLGERMKK